MKLQRHECQAKKGKFKLKKKRRGERRRKRQNSWKTGGKKKDNKV